MQHQPSINAPSIRGTKEANHETMSQTGLQQSPVEDDYAANDHYEFAHDSDDRNEPEVTFVVLIILFDHIYLILALSHYFLIL